MQTENTTTTNQGAGQLRAALTRKQGCGSLQSEVLIPLELTESEAADKYPLLHRGRDYEPVPAYICLDLEKRHFCLDWDSTPESAPLVRLVVHPDNPAYKTADSIRTVLHERRVQGLARRVLSGADCVDEFPGYRLTADAARAADGLCEILNAWLLDTPPESDYWDGPFLGSGLLRDHGSVFYTPRDLLGEFAWYEEWPADTPLLEAAEYISDGYGGEHLCKFTAAEMAEYLKRYLGEAIERGYEPEGTHREVAIEEGFIDA